MLKLKKRTTLAYVLVFDQYDIISKTLEFITKFSDQLDIVIIENPSQSSPKIKNIVDQYGKTGKIKRYYVFEDNIAANAFSIILEKERHIIKKHENVLITDGDLTCKNDEWLNEEKRILKNDSSVFVCGISLDMFNLPVKSFPEAIDWIPPDISEQNDYYEARTGLHLLTFSSGNLLNFLDWFKANSHPFVDSTLHYYCYDVMHKKWARTKVSKAHHLTWDLYDDRDNSYTKLKTGKSHAETWLHRKQSEFKLKEY